MRIVFAGSGEFAVPALRSLAASRHRIACVLTRPDRPAGRGRRLRATPVRQAAEAAGLTVEMPASPAQPDFLELLARLAPDVLAVVAYGKILAPEVLAVARLGAVNVHPSLLPRWRGAAPVERTLAAGDETTGVAIMQMDAGLDTGPLLAQSRTAVRGGETAGELAARLAESGAGLLLAVLDDLEAGRAQPQAQRGEPAYAPRVTPAEAHLDFRLPAAQLVRRILAFNPRPGAWAECAGERVKLLRAETGAPAPGVAPGTVTGVADDALVVAAGSGTVRVTELQRPGRRAQAAAGLQDRVWAGRRFT